MDPPVLLDYLTAMSQSILYLYVLVYSPKFIVSNPLIQ